ncbi:MAG: hypothetical protein M1818_001688 [Claussenomyces sp. TS43310]|nr:MAG: hypothetical protein M1818_001688 [Claussenomyces sp. TS43310]
MEKRVFVQWTHTPLARVAISSSGLLALADLSTIAKRTALTGTSTWLDALFLAPGLHYQQLADSLGFRPQISITTPNLPVQALNLNTGSVLNVTNTATIHYLQRIAKTDTPVILDVGSESTGIRGRRYAVGPSKDGHRYQRTTPASSKISTILYLLGPLLTLCSIAFMILTQDWWGCAIIGALILARALNIWIIHQRTKTTLPVPLSPNDHQNWWINYNGYNVCLRGLAHDLDAITTGEWMRDKTDIEGYVEAIAKLIVYVVAVFSGNTYQTGEIVLIALLLISAALLALSNAYTNTFSMNGKVASVTDRTPITDGYWKQTGQGNRSSTAPLNDSDSGSGWEKSPSDFEKDEAKTVIDNAYPFAEDVNYV